MAMHTHSMDGEMHERRKDMLNHVRQVVMHDLGIDRNAIRELAQQVVKDTVSAYVNGGALDNFIAAEVDRALKTQPRFTGTGLRELVATAVADAIMREVVAKMSLSVTASLQDASK